ncbi:cytochrome P450 monooxygenase [Fonsecaea pedrosoi]|nr:cytochrome P450 monooxygenase [Fonsecaea pedrosoi]
MTLRWRRHAFGRERRYLSPGSHDSPDELITMVARRQHCHVRQPKGVQKEPDESAAIPASGKCCFYGLLPKPIPGIPYNESATRSLLGDIPEMMSYMAKTEEIWPWITEQITKHQSPVVQVFGRPFARPWVIVSDHRESSDILLRRTKEFDRSDFTADVFMGLVPDMHISMKSTENRFKLHRNLLKDLMTPAFLHGVGGPQIYANTETFIKLWNLKTEVAQGHAFEAGEDIYNVALDVIFATTFGLQIQESNTFAQLQQLLGAERFDLPQALTDPISFPQFHRPATFEAIATLTESLEVSVKAPFPRFAHWILRQLPYMRKARADKEKLFSDMIDESLNRLSSGHQAKRSALDDILQRETAAAKKDGRPPRYHSRTIYDELFGFIIGGHDTTSTTFTWTVKYLSTAQSAQTTLRSRLRAAYAVATAEQRNPTMEEIIKIQVPYLDATIEEMSRTAQLFNGSIRTTTTDTTLLGYSIPKGTDVFLMQNGPGYLSPALPVSDSKRSASSLAAKNQVGQWTQDEEDMKTFRPERWLVHDSQVGQEVFDSQAGPHLAFGLGPRACFGRRLAYLQMRIILVMMIWNFELKETPAEVSSWAATNKLARHPRMCYVRLEKAGF